MQSFFIDTPDGMPNRHAADIIDNINRLTVATRAAGGTVLFTQHASSDDPPYKAPAWQEKGSAPPCAPSTPACGRAIRRSRSIPASRSHRATGG